MKIQNNNFLILVERAMFEPGRSHMRPVIEKELLHYDILFALDKAGLLDRLTFQGGTSLRLCYGSPRFSEDLDFVGGYDFETQNLVSMKTCLEDYFVKRYGLEVSIKEPKDLLNEPDNRNITVNKWQLRLVTHPERKDLPKQMIKIEIANIPAYTREPKQLLHNYDFLPDGYSDTIVMVESLNEILADKLIAFVNCHQTYIRYRDIWDLHWLKQQGATIDIELVKKKLHDYKIDDYTEKLDKLLENLYGIIHGKEFREQMSRFLPIAVQEKTLLNKNYLFLLSQEIYEILDGLGFEWKEKKEEIYCTNSLRILNQGNFEKTLNKIKGLRDKDGLVIIYGKKSQALIVSPSDESIAKKLCANPIYTSFLSSGYKVDPSLKPGQWFIKFVDI